MSWLPLRTHKAFMATHAVPPVALDGLPYRQVDLRGKVITIIPDKLPVVSALRTRGEALPSSEEQYKYPGAYAPMDHQRKTVRFLLDHRKCFCLNGIGTGKTASALWAADILMRRQEVRRVLIITTKSTMRSVWEREIFQVLPHRTYATLHGSADRKAEKALDSRYHFLIINPESLHLLPDLPDVDLIIADEATKFKTSRAKRTKVLTGISKDTRLWLLTASPAPQAPTDAYSLCKLVRGNFMSLGAFRDATMFKVSQFKWLPRKDAADTIHRFMQPAIRFSRDECIDLPPCQVIDFSVELTPSQSKLTKSFLSEAYATLHDGKAISAANAAAALSKTLQVMAGGVYGNEVDGEKPAYAVKADPLFETLESIIEQTKGPVLIMAPFRISAAIVHAKLKAAGFTSELVTGATSSDERHRIFSAVQDNSVDAMVAIPQTVSHGLTLTASDTLVWISPPFSYETYEQANGRINRKGQTRKTKIFRIVQNNLTKALFSRLDSKADLQQVLLKLMEDNDV